MLKVCCGSLTLQTSVILLREPNSSAICNSKFFSLGPNRTGYRQNVLQSRHCTTCLLSSPGVIWKPVVQLFQRIPTSFQGIVLMAMVVTVAAVLRAIQKRLSKVSEREDCMECQGFGIQRCSLCEGSGTVGWEGKWSHREPCPLCLGKRFLSCKYCGGKVTKSMFTHKQRTGLSVNESIDGVMSFADKVTD